MYYGIVENEIVWLLERSLNKVLKDRGLTPIPPHELKSELEIPKDTSHGDLSTNIALKHYKGLGLKSLDLANLIKDRMNNELPSSRLKETFDKLETKPPGFINFFFSKGYLYDCILEIKRKRDSFGKCAIGRGLHLQIEFVSANPTGPLTIAHGRQAAIGDSLGNILEFVGYRVAREYYINDEGLQMDTLAASIRARYSELLGMKYDFPADGYKGSYVIEIAKAFKDRFGKRFIKTDDLKPFREFGLKSILNEIRIDLLDFGVKFDVWYSQKELAKSGKVEKALHILKDKGYIYEKDGALWFKSTAFGDDKDRVVQKSDGKSTYIAPDIAYHLDKYKRGFKRLIDIWGPDHHGYIGRLKAAIRALGYTEDTLSILIVQLATLYRSGEVIPMSTRAGEFVTLRQVMDEVGKDVTRFCFLMRRFSSHLDFDLDSVKSQSQENPVYYIQYAHARIWSILEYGRRVKGALTKFDSRLLKEEEELMLLRSLRQFPMIVALSANSLEPYIILQYLQDLATIFHAFYTKHRVVGDDLNLTRARLVLVDCVRAVLANGLRLLGVSLPKKM